MKFYPTIGIEVHAEMATKSKMFCSCKNDPHEKTPNTNICPICMAHPGALPVPNKEAILNIVKVGLAFEGATISEDFSEFDRKNYFYPDIPKGYQISQYKFPFVVGGEFAGFSITRVHLEEDTATSKHDRGDYSLIDFNRAGVPLMELVTEANTYEDFQEAASATSYFARELQLLLRYLGVSNANMEKGEMRVEANISVSPDKDKWGTKVEVKNLNSFKSVEKAILFELERMKKMYEEGTEGNIVQETRGWDENKQSTFSQRSKENAQDYRYFPDPDLPKMRLKDVFDMKDIKSTLTETPDQKRNRFKEVYGIKDEDIESYIYDLDLCSFFEDTCNLLDKKEEYKIASNLITSDFAGIRKSNPEAKIPNKDNFAELVKMFYEDKITSRVAKDILAIMTKEDISPLDYAKDNNLLQSNNQEELIPIIEKIIIENTQVVESYKSGKENAIMALVGQVMKATNGKANPKIALELLKEYASK
ncbi:Asp-tRNA(Asn)/Glu-tRNA(Gln) amidotransferase subunit GatB [Candidatus Nomurabacteria bacterium]|nr:Asp-tRNA(Asn)/Glu-tRNA(Gln) amidotransferase subunit GatB [Candidatus Nomurabacteria bacterium]